MNTWIHQKYIKKVKNCISSGFNLIVFASLQCNLICFSSAGVCASYSDLCFFFVCFSGQTWHGISNFTSHDMLRGFVLTL